MTAKYPKSFHHPDILLRCSQLITGNPYNTQPSSYPHHIQAYNQHPWTGDGTLSSPGGAGSIIYKPQPIRDRPVGGIGDFHTVRGGINPGDISVFVPGLSEVYIRKWITMLGMDPIVAR